MLAALRIADKKGACRTALASLEPCVPHPPENELEHSERNSGRTPVREGLEIGTERTSVYLLAENGLVRDALIRILRSKNDIAIAGSAPFSDCVLESVIKNQPRILVCDSPQVTLTGPNILSRIREESPGTKAVLVGMDEDESTFLRAVGEGVVGYVLKTASAAEVVRAIRAVAVGEAVCPAQFSLSLFQCAARDVRFLLKTRENVGFGLTNREQQLVSLIGLHMTNKEIGSRLHISERTVKNHVHRILQKVGVNNRLQIAEQYRSEDSSLLSQAGIV